MSRVVTFLRSRLPRAVTLIASAVLVAGAVAAPAVAQQDPVACSAERNHDCTLPDWSDARQRDLPSTFGPIDGVVWIEDEIGDAPEVGLDILAAGVGRVTIGDPEAVRQAPGLRKLGKTKKAVPAGDALVVRVVLDRGPEEAAGGHASIHVATDIKGSRSNNVPSGVAAPDYPFAGSQDVYSLTWASTTGKIRLHDSDLSNGWYKDKDPFAAAWAGPGVLDMLIKPSAFGEGFRVVTHAAGGQGGYDTLTLGPAAIPTDGRVGLVPACIEGSILAEPFSVTRLVENGQVVRDVEAQASWRGGAVVPIEDEERQALSDLIAANGAESLVDRVTIPAWVSLFEDGIVIRQRADLQLALAEDDALLATELGLTRRGYNVLRDFEPDPTGDAALDTWLERATDALRETVPPFRLNKRSGLLIGEAIGACIPWIEPAAEPGPEPSPASPASSSSPVTDPSAEPVEEAAAASA